MKLPQGLLSDTEYLKNGSYNIRYEKYQQIAKNDIFFSKQHERQNDLFHSPQSTAEIIIRNNFNYKLVFLILFIQVKSHTNVITVTSVSRQLYHSAHILIPTLVNGLTNVRNVERLSQLHRSSVDMLLHTQKNDRFHVINVLKNLIDLVRQLSQPAFIY